MNSDPVFVEDVRGRVARLQRVMSERDIGAVILTAAAGPGLFGVAKYFTNLVMWYGRAYVVIGRDHPEAAIVHWSSWQAEWNRQEAATSWIETPDSSVALDAIGAFRRAIAIARELADESTRIGVEHHAETWLAGEADLVRREHSECLLIDLSGDIDALRSIKSPFELAEMRETGNVLEASFDAFARVARPGMRIWEATSAAEEVAKAAGCTWGRSKMALTRSPVTTPPAIDRTFHRDDVFVLELDYSSPHGYWYEMTQALSFKSLPGPLAKHLGAYDQVISEIATLAVDGTPIGQLATEADDAFARRGFRVTGKHLPDAHSIGLDETDGPNSTSTPQALLRRGMAVVLHPGSLFGEGEGFLISDVFEISDGGALRMTPGHTSYRRLNIGA